MEHRPKAMDLPLDRRHLRDTAHLLRDMASHSQGMDHPHRATDHPQGSQATVNLLRLARKAQWNA